DPVVAEAGPLLTMARSVDGGPKEVTAVALLLATGSEVVLVTVAVLETLVPVNVGAVVNVLVMTFDCPAVIVPRAQGNGVRHAPALERKVVPAGVASLTTTAAASD